jgi:L-gulonate 5-dehydrogenase
MAKLAGATVIISDLVDDKLAYAKTLGADYIINAKKENALQKVREITNGMGANVTIDAVCIKKSFEDAVEITSPAGRVVEMSFNETPSEIAPVLITKKELTVCGSRLQTNRFPVVIDYLKKGQLPLKGFVTATYGIDQMTEAFAYIDAHGEEVRKLLVKF